MNPLNPNETEFFGIIRIDSDRTDSFRLKAQINSDSFGLQIRIDFEWATDWFGLKTNFGLDRDEADSDRSDSFVLKVRIDQFDRIHSD